MALARQHRRPTTLSPPPNRDPDPTANTTEQGSEPLNGAQVTALLDVIGRVRTGELPKDVAKQTVAAAFPIPAERIDSIIDPIRANASVETGATAPNRSPEPTGGED